MENQGANLWGRQVWHLTDDAAAHIKYKPRTLVAWRERGVGPEYVKAGGRVRYAEDKLDEYMNLPEDHPRKSSPPPRKSAQAEQPSAGA